MSVVAGLLAALFYGAADFLGGTAARRIGSPTTTALSTTAGLVLAAAVVLPGVALGGGWNTEALLVGALSSVAGSASILFLYAALAIGPMSIISPLTALLSAIVPVAWALVGGEPLGPGHLVGLALAFVAVALVGLVPGDGAVRPRPLGILLGVAAGVSIGVYLVILDAAPDGAGLQPVLANRLIGAVGLGILALALVARARRRGAAPPRPDRRSVALAAGAGASDVAANALILLGFATGNLAVVAVLVALYPAGTILLAAVVHRERIARIQIVGLVLALVAAAVLAAATAG